MENEIIVINGCSNCPFRSSEWDDFAVGADVFERCLLALHNGSTDYIIECWDTKKDEEATLETPTWCPMKDSELLIKFKK